MLDLLLIIILFQVELLEDLLLLGYLQMGVGSITIWLAVLFEMELYLVVIVQRDGLLWLLLALLSLLLGHTLGSHQEHLLRLTLLCMVVCHGRYIIHSLVLLLSLVIALVACSSRGLLLLRLLLARLRQLLLILFALVSYGGSPRRRLLLLDLVLMLLNLHLLLGGS